MSKVILVYSEVFKKLDFGKGHPLSQFCDGNEFISK
jgi:hypothetical protein